MTQRRYPLRAAVAGLTLVLFAGCSRTNDPGADGVSLPANTSVSATAATGTTSSSVTTTTGTPGGTAPDGTAWTADQLNLIAAQKAYIDAYRGAATTSDSNDQRLDATMADKVLVASRALFAQRQSLGMATRPGTVPFQLVPVAAVTGASASVTTCTVNSDVIYRTADGGVVNGDVVTERRVSQLALRDGVWKVVTDDRQQQWAGEELTQCVDVSS